VKTIIRVYRTNAGWRWQLRDYRNRKIIGASTEVYVRRPACIANLRRVTGCDVRVPSGKSASERTVRLGGREWWLP